MILRINLLEANACNAIPQPISTQNLSVTINYAGTQIFNTADLLTAVLPTGVTIENDNILVLDTRDLPENLPHVWSSTSLQLVVEKDGNTYNNTFEIFGYDLGNNAALDINYNPDFNVVMTSAAFSSVIAYRKPLTDEILYYDGNSSPGSKTLYEFGTNKELGGRNGVIFNGARISVYQETIIREITGTDNCGYPTYEIIDQCTQSRALTIDYNKKWFPDFTLNYRGTPLTPDDCTTTETDSTVYLFVDYEKLDKYWVNDQEEYLYNANQIAFQLFNSSGFIIDSQLYNSFDLPSPATPVNYNPQDYNYSFNFDQVGDYVVKAIFYHQYIEDEEYKNLQICEKFRDIRAKNWYTIEQLSCQSYRINNASFDTITVELEQIEDKVEKLRSIHIEPLKHQDISFSTDGIYSIRIKRGEEEYVSIQAVYCTLIGCMEKLIQKLVQHPEQCETPEEYKRLMKLIPLAITYFMKLNKEYNFNFFYTSLEPSKIDELYTAKQLYNKMMDYCDPKEEKC